MNRRKWLTALSAFFSITTIGLILSEWILGHPSISTGWGELSLSLMFLTGGLNRYLDKRQYGGVYLGTGLFLFVAFITITVIRKV